jgi:hypothetical protein
MSNDTSCTWYLHDVMVRYQQFFCLNLVRSHLMSGENLYLHEVRV